MAPQIETDNPSTTEVAPPHILFTSDDPDGMPLLMILDRNLILPSRFASCHDHEHIKAAHKAMKRRAQKPFHERILKAREKLKNTIHDRSFLISPSILSPQARR